MSEGQIEWFGVVAGALLIAVAVLAWWAGARWRLASAIFLFAGAAMGARLALKGAGNELVTYEGEATAFRVLAAVISFVCLFAGVRQFAMWFRYGNAPIGE